MEPLPLLVLEPEAPALLPGERRRLALETEGARTALRRAGREGGRIAVVAFDPALRREGEKPGAHPDRLLPVATACTVLRAEIDDEGGLAVVRGRGRVRIEPLDAEAGRDLGAGIASGATVACTPIVSTSGPEDADAFDDLLALLRGLDLLPALRPQAALEARIDRIAIALALVPWAQAEVLTAPALLTRVQRLTDAARELSAPGASFRPAEIDAPYRDAEEHLEDLVRLWDCRARALQTAGFSHEDRARSLLHGAELRRRRRAAALRERATRARIARRLAASARAGALPPLERIRIEHALGPGSIDALLAAGLSGHERFADRIRRAARLLPPDEMPLAAWIAALEAGAFPAGGPR